MENDECLGDELMEQDNEIADYDASVDVEEDGDEDEKTKSKWKKPMKVTVFQTVIKRCQVWMNWMGLMRLKEAQKWDMDMTPGGGQVTGVQLPPFGNGTGVPQNIVGTARGATDKDMTPGEG